VTTIEWTEQTWNPTTGCDRISPGCDHCYALTMAKRLKGMGQAKYQNDGNPKTSGPGFALTVHPDALDEPYRWKKPRKVFVNSMSDLFHARVPREFLAQVFAVMAFTPQHSYQILTKRPERTARILADSSFAKSVEKAMYDDDAYATLARGGLKSWPLPNVWIGTSIESDDYTRRSDALRNTPAAVRFISAEPLLGPLPSLNLTDIDWLIIGGESGPGARVLEPWWIDDLVYEARRAGAAPFVKQLGSVWARHTIVDGKTVAAHGDTKGGKPEYWPAKLRVREYPKAASDG
jgi:protein gp37